MLTFDLECWDEGDWLQPHLASAPVADPASDRAITERIMALLEDANATATFFVTTRFLERYPETVEVLHAAGHEIGTHGPRHLRLQRQEPAAFRNDVREQKRLLAALGGIVPAGYRAPHFSLEARTAWILPILKEEGYVYDSSQFAAAGLEYGSSRVPNGPYPIGTPAGPLREIPVPGLPCGPWRLPFAGGVYFRLIPEGLYDRLLSHLAKTTTPLVYLHPHELSAETPRLARGPFWKRRLKYHGVGRAFAKLARLTGSWHCVSIAQAYFPPA